MAFGGEVTGADGLDGMDHAAIALEQFVGKANDARVGMGGARGASDRPGNLLFVAFGIERASRHKCAGTRTADACLAMNQHRSLTGPAPREFKNGDDALAIRRDQAVCRLRDIMKIKLQMLLECSFARCAVLMGRRQQRQHMGRPMTRDGGVEMLQRADDDHEFRGSV